MATNRNRVDTAEPAGAEVEIDTSPSGAQDRVAEVDEHLSRGINRASDGALAAVSAFEERSRSAIAAARQRADEARITLERLEREASAQADRTQQQVTALIREKPLQSAGIAFAAGVFATMLLRRR